MADEAQQDVEAFFKDKMTVTVAEAAVVLGDYVETRRLADPEYAAGEALARSIEYAAAFAATRNQVAMRKIRTLLQGKGLTEQELAMVANLQVSDAEEAKALIPTLAGRLDDAELQAALDEVATYAEAT